LTVATAVGDVISDRIDRLGGTTRRVLSVASVIGPSFWPDLVIDLTDASPLSVVTALEEAEEAALVRAADGNDRGGRYEFAHAIYRDLLYAGLAPLRRAVEHHRVGEAIERIYASQPEPWLELLAYQFEHGHDDEDRRKAIGYLRAAAAQAQQRLANDQAAALYRRALDLADQAEPRDPHQRCDLLIELGNAERRAGLPRARRTLLEAVDSAITLSDGASAARAAFGAGRGGIFNMAGSIDSERVGVLRRTLDLVGPDPTPQRARLLAALSAELLFDDDPTAAERASDEALRIARELGDAPTLVTVMTLRMVALWRPDTVEKRLHLGAELDAIREAAGAEHSGQFLSGVTHYCQAAMEGGEWELADRLLGWIDETASQLRQPTTVGYAKLRLASRACIAGLFEAAELLAREAYELTAQAGQTDAEAFYVGNVFNIRLHQGRLGEVVDDMERCARTFPGVRAFLGGAAAGAAEIGDLDRCRTLFDELAGELDSIHFDLNWLTTIAMSAQAAAELHDVARAAHIRGLLLPYRHQFVDNTSTFFGSVEHYLGMVSAVLDDWAGVDHAFTEATRAHEALGSPPLLARTQLEYARALSHRDPVPVAQVVALGRAAQDSAQRHGLASIAERSAGLLRRFDVALA
jgi:hypothetical protein